MVLCWQHQLNHHLKSACNQNNIYRSMAAFNGCGEAVKGWLCTFNCLSIWNYLGKYDPMCCNHSSKDGYFYPLQLMSRKPDEVTPAAVKPHRKSHSYSGLGTAPSFNRQLSPHHGRQSIASPQHTSNGSKFSPNYTKHTDEQHSSIYGEKT